MTENNIDYNQNDQPSPGSNFLRDLTLINLARSGANSHLNDAQRKHQAATKANEQLQSQLAENEKRARAIAAKANNLDDEVVDLEQTVAILRKEVLKLNELLSLPLNQIAQYHKEFAQNYEDQMIKQAEWMVSQKAFKELAIELGAEKGLSVEEVIKIANDKKLDVLNNNNNSEHGTNANGVTTIENRVDILKEKITSQVNLASKPQVISNIRSIQDKSLSPTAKNNFSI
jgi:vacuolar-type H+-ATPase subunit I/STV1